jgi:hypothetical protein
MREQSTNTDKAEFVHAAADTGKIEELGGGCGEGGLFKEIGEVGGG